MIPSEHNVEKFIDWVHAHDLYQVPDLATGILRDQEAVNDDTTAGNDDLRAASARRDPAAARQSERVARQRLPRLSRIFGGAGPPAVWNRLVSAAFNAADVQGNIVRGYRKPRVRYLMLEVTDRNAARRWLAASVSGRDTVPQITPETTWTTKPDTCFNIGLTYRGTARARHAGLFARDVPDRVHRRHEQPGAEAR